ncbi:response regulator [Leucobacter albus]|uniref:Response regulator n=1 Tax=Leucobacter albus TaxID=272210 RepID=A0ABW3TR34_9MICO
MIHLLLVDDHPTLRHGLRALLDTQLDLEVIAEAGGLDDAVAALTAATGEGRAPGVALVDLDLGADAPDGIATLVELVRHAPGLRVIVFSAYDSDADVVRAMEAGAAGYLVKDSAPEQLFRAVRAAAAGQPAFAAPIAARLHDRGRFDEETLTARELEVLTLAATGLSNRELALELLLSEATVKTHLHHAFTKLDASNRQAAIAIALKRGIIRL